MLPCGSCALRGRGLTCRFGSGKHPPHPPTAGTAQLCMPCLEGSRGQGLPPRRQVTRLDAVYGPVGMKPGWTSSLRARLVCGLTSQLPSLIAYKRKSFEFKESNHCSCYEATVWKAFVDCLLKASSVPFHTSLSHCVTFSVLAFFFFLILLAHATVKLQV